MLPTYLSLSLLSDGTLNPNGVRFGSSEIYNIGTGRPQTCCWVLGSQGLLGVVTSGRSGRRALPALYLGPLPWMSGHQLSPL